MDPLQINDLPLQVFSRILSFLNFNQRQTASIVCKRWYQASQDPQFLNSTLINMDADYDDWDVLGGIGKRKIQNLLIEFEEGETVSPEIAHHVELASHVTNLRMTGPVKAIEVIFCLRHFSNLKSLKIESYLSPKEFLGKNKTKLCSALTQLTSLSFEIPGFRSDVTQLVTLLSCFTRIKNLSLTCYDECDRTSESPMNGEFVNNTFAKINLVRNLQEIDLSCFYMNHKSFKDFLKTPNLRLRSLTFVSEDGKGRNLKCLADSDLDQLESLSIYCDGQECYDIRYRMITPIIAKKTSLKSLDCQNVKYLSCSNRRMAVLMEDWRNIADLTIRPAFRDEANVYFRMHDHSNRLALRVSSPCDSKALKTLAKRSLELRKLKIVKCVDEYDTTWMSVIADSFSELTELSLDDCNLANVNLTVLGNSMDTGGSKLAKLRVLRIERCSGVTDDDFKGFHFPKLEWLWLTKSKDITDKAVHIIVSSNPMLQLLGLSGCTLVTDEGVRAIGRLKYLLCLVLSDCPITLEAATIIIDKCQMLEVIDVSRCDQSLIDSLKEQRKSLPFFRKVVHEYDCMFEDQWKFALS